MPINILAAEISGSGSRFATAYINQCMKDLHTESGRKLDYNSVGSVAGQKTIKEGKVDFVISDMPMSREEIDDEKIIQLPLLAGGIVLIVNIDNIKEPIILSGQIVSDIFKGKITKWNDRQIVEKNPKVHFPNQKINVIHRKDESGVTYWFSHYLAAVDGKFWKEHPFKPAAFINWPVGQGVEGNEGVAYTVSSTDNSIGYVDFYQAKLNKHNMVKLINRDGATIHPTIESMSAAAQNSEWTQSSESLTLSIINLPGKESWPIVMPSYFIIRKDSPKLKETISLIKWCYEKSNDTAYKLNFVPIPKNIVGITQFVLKNYTS